MKLRHLVELLSAANELNSLLHPAPAQISTQVEHMVTGNDTLEQFQRFCEILGKIQYNANLILCEDFPLRPEVVRPDVF